jgi:hypothetical protein
MRGPNRPTEEPGWGDELLNSDLLSSVGLDQCDDFVTSVSLCPSKVEQIIDACHHCSALWSTHHSHTATSREVKQFFVTKNVQSSDHGVLVHAEYGRQVDGWGKTFALRGLTFGNSSSDLGGDLIVERDRLLLVDL